MPQDNIIPLFSDPNLLSSIYDTDSSSDESAPESEYDTSDNPLDSPHYPPRPIPSEHVENIIKNGLFIPFHFDLRELLTKATGTQNLETVTSLRVKILADAFSIQRIPNYLPNLQELKLNGSYMTSLRDLGCNMRNLRILHVAQTGLTTLDGLFALHGLEELYAQSNNIANICQLSILPNLTIFDISYNEILDTSMVSFLSLCKSLKHLMLGGNPCCKIKNYRKTIERILPFLISLDGINFGEILDIPPKFASQFPPIPLKKLKQMERPHTSRTETSNHLEKMKLLPIRPASADCISLRKLRNGSDYKIDDVFTKYVASKFTPRKHFNDNLTMEVYEEKHNSLDN